MLEVEHLHDEAQVCFYLLQTDFYAEEGGQNGSFESKSCWPLPQGFHNIDWPADDRKLLLTELAVSPSLYAKLSEIASDRSFIFSIANAFLH